jgi:hypothetical protein
MSYKQEKPDSITVRITKRQRKMLDEMTQEWNKSLSDVIRNILDEELLRRMWSAESMVPTRRPRVLR